MQQLLSYLRTLPDLEGASRDIAKALGWRLNEPAEIANRNVNTFLVWTEERAHQKPQRTTYIAVHPNLRRHYAMESK